MKVIITGATGFVGRNIAEALAKDSFEVVATGRNQKIGEELQKSGIKFIKAEITDYDEVKGAFSSADIVVHCAAKTADWGKYDEFYQTNVIGTRNVINACREHDISKIIFISTPSVYYSGKDRLNIKEDEPLPEKQFYYGKTKIISENELLNLKSEGFQTIILRPRAVYGPYDNTIVPRILKLSEKKNLPLINGGKALVDLTYIDNLVSAIKNCFSADNNSWNEIYNISNGNPIRISDWFSQVLSIFERPFNPKTIAEPIAKTMAVISETLSRLPFSNKKPQLTRFSVGYMAKSMTMNIDKAKEKLDYVPKISNEQGFRLYKEWYTI